MISTITANVVRLLVLVLVQVLLVDHLDVANGYVVPYLYVLFLLLLPFELPAVLGLFIGAATGLLLDTFSSTPGMHMGACTLLMFARIQLLRIIAPRDGYEFGMQPTVQSMGLAWFVTYAGLLVLAHHLWLFFIEMGRLDRFPTTLSRAVLSAAATLALCILAQFLSGRPKRARA
jgi:rod shape-determining protein MreD